jgi:ligand-binding sensor domain-containing protein
MNKWIVATLMYVLLSLHGYSQRYSFISYSTENGLPQSQVTAITQDLQGYLWVGTLGGLAQFNGQKFVAFTAENGLLNNRISCLFSEDKALWIGHEGGISMRRNNRIVHWSLPKSADQIAVTDIIRFKGRLIVATNGAGLFELTNNQLKSITGRVVNHIVFQDQSAITYHKDDDLRVRDLLIYKGDLYIGTRGGLIVTSNLSEFRHDHKWDDFNISGLTQFNNRLAATTYENGFVGESSNRSEIRELVSMDPEIRLRGCQIDKSGQAWLYAAQGVTMIKKNKQRLVFNETNGLPMENIRVVFEDRFGNIWFGSEGKGLLRFPGLDFVYFNQQTGISSDLILSASMDVDGSYWFGTYDKGIAHMKRDRSFESFALEHSNTVWSSALHVNGSHWFGTGDGLVQLLPSGKTKVFFDSDGLPGNKITALHKVSDEVMYIGGESGVSVYRKGKFYRLPMSSASTVRSFAWCNGQLYCGTDRGLAAVKKGKVELLRIFNQPVFSVYANQENELWIGNESGLYLLRKGKIEQVNLSNLAASSFITFITGKGKTVYVGTNNGLYAVNADLQGKFSIRNYGISDGLVNLETNLNSGFVDPTGRLWFGTSSGLVSFLAASTDHTGDKPLLALDQLWFNFQRDTTGRFVDQRNRFGIPTRITVPYAQNTISVEIDGIDMAGSEGLKFQYWLVGLDDHWRPPNDNRTITFSALPARDYLLRVRGINAKGNFSDELHLAITVNVAFYKSWWFIGLILIAVTWIVVRFFRFRLLREREKSEREKLEYSSRLLTLEQKSLNASMNRHFIFNSLNSIQYYINTQDKRSANKFLTNFAKLIRKNLDSSEEGNLVSLEEEIERLELYCSLESMRFNNRFEFTIHVAPQIDTEAIILPAMLLQPFIENSIIHGILPLENQRCHIQVTIELVRDMLIITIDDDGMGVDKSKAMKNPDATEHQSQGVDIIAKRIDLLQKLTGKIMSITGPVELKNEIGESAGTRVIVKIQL